jgi:hypothetical protein
MKTLIKNLMKQDLKTCLGITTWRIQLNLLTLLMLVVMEEVEVNMVEIEVIEVVIEDMELLTEEDMIMVKNMKEEDKMVIIEDQEKNISIMMIPTNKKLLQTQRDN